MQKTLIPLLILFFALLTSCNPIEDNRRLLVTGSIETSSNQPLSGLDILVTNQNQTIKVGEATTDENGSFRSVGIMPSGTVAIEFEITDEIDIPESLSSLRRRTIFVERSIFDMSKHIELPPVRISELSDVTIRLIDASGTLERFVYRFNSEVFSSNNFRISEVAQLNRPINDFEIIGQFTSSNAQNGFLEIRRLFVKNQTIFFEYVPAGGDPNEWEQVILEINENTHEFEIFF
jgi:hypothetical protein